MLRQEDLDAAVSENIVTAAPAVALADFAARRQLARDALVGHEERFRFMRRALLVFTFSYLGIVIAYAITTARATAPAAVFFSTLAVLGILVLGFGVGWQPLRRALLTLLPTAAVDRLPPAVQAA
jgi:hypothetical protein